MKKTFVLILTIVGDADVTPSAGATSLFRVDRSGQTLDYIYK